MFVHFEFFVLFYYKLQNPRFIAGRRIILAKVIYFILKTTSFILILTFSSKFSQTQTYRPHLQQIFFCNTTIRTLLTQISVFVQKLSEMVLQTSAYQQHNVLLDERIAFSVWCIVDRCIYPAQFIQSKLELFVFIFSF